MLPFDTHPDAEAEVNAAADWFDERSPGRGDVFRAAVADTIEFVCRHLGWASRNPKACESGVFWDSITE